MNTEVYALANGTDRMALEEVDDVSFVENDDVQFGTVNRRKFVYWGGDNLMPYGLMRLVAHDEVMSQAKHFNILTCFGCGVEYRDIDTGERATNGEVVRFMRDNALQTYFLEQCTDMKFFAFAVSVIILNREGTKIVEVRHKDACNVRFEKANAAGRIEHIFYGNFDKSGTYTDIQTIELLDERNPLGDLRVRLGLQPDRHGMLHRATNVRKFAVLAKFPMPGNPYYPQPYYTSIFRSDWYTIKQLIQKSKKAKVKNLTGIRYQVEVNRDYWDHICDDEQIFDPAERLKRIAQEKENIRNFVSGIENNGKMWFSKMYIDPNGKEVSEVKVTQIDTTKAGGDWSEDIQEAANMICFAEGIHPNLVGAVPGKSQSNNSGSDKRELFTLKQAIEIAYHHVLMTPHNLIIAFNGWNVRPDVPMITLTTLDAHADAQKVTPNNDEPAQVNE